MLVSENAKLTSTVASLAGAVLRISGPKSQPTGVVASESFTGSTPFTLLQQPPVLASPTPTFPLGTAYHGRSAAKQPQWAPPTLFPMPVQIQQQTQQPVLDKAYDQISVSSSLF